MQTHVYANGREIACKAAGQDGVSPQAFPDPCWSPPGPAAGPIVIPYPNTCFADSIANGTSTVFICGKEVAIEDKSYFGTSTGNEPATQAFKKGVATGVITGKAYFTQWSFDVAFEGFGVPRHTDVVSHNHGSVPGNTPLFPYLSRAAVSAKCEKEKEKMEKACAPEKKDAEPELNKKGEKSFTALLKERRKGRKKVGQRDSKNWHWTDDHCDGLEYSVGSAKTAEKYAEEMKRAFESLPSEMAVLDTVKSELKSMITDAARNAAGKFAAKAGMKQALGSSVPAFGNFAMAIWSIYDAVTAISDVKEIKKAATIALHELEKFKGRLTALSAHAGKFDKLTSQQLHAMMVEAQEALATLNPCTRAKRCHLVPHESTKASDPFPDVLEPTKKGGCCPGQTGHHLIPRESLDEKCTGYSHPLAPTVCAEGTTQFFGSHQRVHRNLAAIHGDMAEDGKIARDGSMSMDNALSAAVESHSESFPLSNCGKDCIRAQLEGYYKKVCPNIRPKMVNASSKQTVPPEKPVDDGPTG